MPKNRRGENMTKPQAEESQAERDRRAVRESVKYAARREPDDPVPENMDVFRLALTRRILTLCGLPRRCREPVCRRAKRCLGPDLRCQRDFPGRPLTPEQEANARAALKRALDRRIAAFGAGEGRLRR
jgi:hypothetical protein